MLPVQDSWRVNTTHVSSFVLISILRGQPRTPPSGDNLGVLDYHLKYFISHSFGLVRNILFIILERLIVRIAEKMTIFDVVSGH